eukprot:TRINITY_DN255_c0_g1_i1.p1 TRINITY_DN255_c0_g1~~TRINITY_DN255_c0_g1_i1.p1  ORF type:complete len:183 (+),score=23.30 TRINITY_DN255_c0_g1_i1:58-549(+)
MSELKNDHIVFKNNNFAKVGSYESWSVTEPTECNFGKWILKQETEGRDFTKTDIWKDMKIYHEKVHSSVGDYVTLNSKRVPNSELEQVSRDLESHTAKLFSIMDRLKENRCSKMEQSHTAEKSIKKEQKEVKISSKPIASKPKEVPKTVAPKKSNDEDEWESF